MFEPLDHVNNIRYEILIINILIIIWLKNLMKISFSNCIITTEFHLSTRVECDLSVEIPDV